MQYTKLQNSNSGEMSARFLIKANRKSGRTTTQQPSPVTNDYYTNLAAGDGGVPDELFARTFSRGEQSTFLRQISSNNKLLPEKMTSPSRSNSMEIITPKSPERIEHIRTDASPNSGSYAAILVEGVQDDGVSKNPFANIIVVPNSDRESFK